VPFDLAQGLELVETARDPSSVLSAIASATAEGLAKEDPEVRIARERASYIGHPTGSCPQVTIVIFA
jgi:hypothetical protein